MVFFYLTESHLSNNTVISVALKNDKDLTEVYKANWTQTRVKLGLVSQFYGHVGYNCTFMENLVNLITSINRSLCIKVTKPMSHVYFIKSKRRRNFVETIMVFYNMRESHLSNRMMISVALKATKISL